MNQTNEKETYTGIVFEADTFAQMTNGDISLFELDASNPESGDTSTDPLWITWESR